MKEKLTGKQEAIAALKEAYSTVFKTPEGQIVLNDLRTFTRVSPVNCNDAALRIDPLKMAVQAGRRETADRIDVFLNTELSTLFIIYGEDHG